VLDALFLAKFYRAFFKSLSDLLRIESLLKIFDAGV
jgi:hypothetical protein